ncbi:complex I subunit 5 family protein [Pseudoalteromonas sp.]|uniref:complex I subunit 5 family protein n=1 Tax=Pseudoalteromonas sp. TaxID=53249 RepID=UPI001BCE74DF|nr:complex I subunit 5 family protein [Pseudoalteromonas sp.]
MTFLQFWLLLTPCAPFLAITAFFHPNWRKYLPYLSVLAPLPALILSFMPSQSLSVPWLFLGSVWMADEMQHIFLRVSALLWFFSACYGVGYINNSTKAPRFWLLWLMTLSGNLGLIISQDIVSFYGFFALMTFSAYGLVIHNQNKAALFAGKVYLVMAVIGEMFILAGLFLTSEAASHSSVLFTDLRASLIHANNLPLIISCLLIGFGVKAGLPFLHMWLPLAHPVAPTPASAVLSGAMIKAGLFAWLTLIPLGIITLPNIGFTMLLLGLFAAFGAAIIGFCQSAPKAILAYSSISQMGLISCAIGTALIFPQSWQTLFPVVLLFTFHHGITKGALFLSVGIKEHYKSIPIIIICTAMLIPALSLIGVFNSGIHAKLALKHALSAPYLPTWLLPSITATAATTTLLMLRFLYCLWLEKAVTPKKLPPSMLIGWLSLVSLCALGPSLLLSELTLPTILQQWQQALNLVWLPLFTLLVWYFLRPYCTYSFKAGDILFPLLKIKVFLDYIQLHRPVFKTPLKLSLVQHLPAILNRLNCIEHTFSRYIAASFILIIALFVVAVLF